MAVAAATVSPPAPLIVWRIAKAGRAAFDGEGARLYGGRWNHPGVRVVYTSGSLALAALETFVNLDTDLAPADLVAIRVEIPGGSELETVAVADLARNWRRCPAPESLQDLGTEWIGRGEALVLAVPSAVAREERNYLLNPAHPGFAGVRFGRPRRFDFDPRLRR